MNNIAKCNRCGEFLSAEFVETHHVKDVKQIFLDYFVQAKTDNNEDIIVAMGLDGVLYRLIVSKVRNFSHLSDDSLQGKSSDKNLTT